MKIKKIYRKFNFYSPFFRLFIDHESLLWSTNREDARLRWVDNRTEVCDIEHAQVGNGEGSALELLWLQLSVTCLGREGLDVF